MDDYLWEKDRMRYYKDYMAYIKDYDDGDTDYSGYGYTYGDWLVEMMCDKEFYVEEDEHWKD